MKEKERNDEVDLGLDVGILLRLILENWDGMGWVDWIGVTRMRHNIAFFPPYCLNCFALSF